MPLTGEAYNQYMKEYMLRRYHKRRAFALSLLGDVCCRCGTTENLEFDHIDRYQKSFKIAKLWSCSFKSFVAEISKCQVLCRPCHQDKSREYGDYLPKGR